MIQFLLVGNSEAILSLPGLELFWIWAGRRTKILTLWLKRTRETYMVVRLDENEPQFCWVKKFENQCRGKDYRVKLSEIELLPNQTNEEQSNDADEEFGDDELEN